jgi:competence protein ComEA
VKLVRLMVAVGLGVLLSAPIAAQTTPSSKSPGGPAATAPSTTTARPATAPSATPPSSTTSGSQQGGLVDINSASAEELDKLPGIGPARAKAIIAHRPYNGKDDLTQRKVIPANVYAQIKDKIIAKQK